MGSLEGAVWVNVWHLRLTVSGSPALADLRAVTLSFAASFRTELLIELSNQVVQEQQRAVWITGPTDQLAVDTFDTGAGAQTSPVLPASVSALLLWAISASYRGGHPRTYLPGPTEDMMDGARRLTGATRAAIATAAEAFRTNVNTISHGGITGVELGTVAFFRGHSALSPPVFEPYLAVGVSPLWGNQRRRVRPR